VGDERDQRRAGSWTSLLFIPDPPGRPPAFSILPTDQEPETGYTLSSP